MLLDKSIHIRASADRVFALLAPSRMARWDRSLVRALGPGPDGLAEGVHFERVGRELGYRFAMEAEATDVEDGRLFAWRQVAGDYERHEGAFVLEPEGDGTRLHLVADVELPYVLPRLVTEAEVEAALSREADDALFNLKALSEAAAR